jgi:hypothetical protein
MASLTLLESERWIGTYLIDCRVVNLISRMRDLSRFDSLDFDEQRMLCPNRESFLFQPTFRLFTEAEVKIPKHVSENKAHFVICQAVAFVIRLNSLLGFKSLGFRDYVLTFCRCSSSDQMRMAAEQSFCQRQTETSIRVTSVRE